MSHRYLFALEFSQKATSALGYLDPYFTQGNGLTVSQIHMLKM